MISQSGMYISQSFHQTKMNEVPEDLPEVLNDFDIEEEEIAIENRFGLLPDI